MLKLYNYVQVKIAANQKSGVHPKYSDYGGQKGIVIDIDPLFGGKSYALFYEDASFRDFDRKNGCLYIASEDIVKLADTNEELVAQYTAQREKEAYEQKYKWGKCAKCGAPLDMFFTLWCPTCTSKEDLIEDKVLINILKCLTWCDVRVPGIKDRVWEYFCLHYDFMNGVIKRFQFENWLDSSDVDLRFIGKEFSGLGIKYIEFSW